jgi:hypothetical protein
MIENETIRFYPPSVVETIAKEFENQKPVEARRVKYTINLDWFECLFSGFLIDFDSPLEKYDYDSGNIRLIKKEMPTKLFKYSYDVFVRNIHFAHINLVPRNNAILKPDTIQFQAKNNVLYEVGFIQEVKYLMQKMNWQMLNQSRIDIAIDGVNCLKVAKKVRTEMNVSGEWQKLGKAKLQAFMEGSKGILTGYNVGSMDSSKWITCYDKTKEMEITNKYYIRDMWARAGLDTSKVERIEMKLRNEAIKQITDFDWTRLDDFEYLASVFRTHCKNFFEFVNVRSREKNTTRKKRMSWIDWQHIGAVKLPKMSTKQSNEVYRMKMAAKTLYGIYVLTGKDHYVKLAQEIAENVNCLSWYAERLEKWREFFQKKAGNNPDGVIEYQYLSRYTEYQNNEQLKLYTYEPPVYVPRY